MKENIKTVNCEFSYKCPQNWEALSETSQNLIRFCDVCQSKVYFAENEQFLEKLRNEGKCVAVYKEIANNEFIHQSIVEMGIPASTVNVETSNKPIGTETTQIELEQIKDEKIIIKGIFEDLRKKLSGYALNDCEPGSDGAVYVIDRNSFDKSCWDLYRCCEIIINTESFIEVAKTGEKLSAENLYKKLELVDIYLLGRETIALGLPYHIDPYGFY